MDAQQIANTVATFAKNGTTFMYVLALAVGILLVLLALKNIVLKGSDRTPLEISWGGIAFRLLIGGLLVTMGWTLQQVFGSVGEASEVRSALAYVQNSSNDQVSQAIWAAIRAWCVFLGTVGFFRGFLILDRATQGGRESGDDVWRAFWHILGGAITIQVFS